MARVPDFLQNVTLFQDLDAEALATLASLLTPIKFTIGAIIFRELDDSDALYIVEKGSVAIDGISLTVAGVGRDWFRVWIIPHTRTITNLRSRHVGDAVNLEVDILAKYVERMLAR